MQRGSHLTQPNFFVHAVHLLPLLLLTLRCVVMVGDPQQLPATIFSQAAKQLALERSLFERLSAVSSCCCIYATAESIQY